MVCISSESITLVSSNEEPPRDGVPTAGAHLAGRTELGRVTQEYLPAGYACPPGSGKQRDAAAFEQHREIDRLPDLQRLVIADSLADPAAGAQGGVELEHISAAVFMVLECTYRAKRFADI